MLLLALAAFGPSMFTVALMGVGPRGSLPATGVLQGYLLGLAWAAVLGAVAEYRVKILVGIVALGATFVGSSYVVAHTSGAEVAAVALAALFAGGEGLITLLFFLSAARPAPRHTGWAWGRFATCALPLLPVILLAFFRDQLSLTINGAILCALLIVAINIAFRDRA